MLRIVNVCRKVVGDRQVKMNMLYEGQVVQRAWMVVKDPVT